MSHLGVVCVHGLGGTPHSVLPITAAVHEAGYPTVAPRLPGHGTHPEDLIGVTWDHWLEAVLEAVDSMAGRTERVVVVGQSMGGTLALHVAATRSSIAGVATVNALALAPDPDANEHLEHLIARGRTMQPAGEPDLRDPAAHDSAYAELALTALLQLGAGAAMAGELLPSISVPVLVVSSDLDGTVDPANSDEIAARVGGAVTRVRLPRSGHVAALDLDRDQLVTALLDWLAHLTDQSATSA